MIETTLVIGGFVTAIALGFRLIKKLKYAISRSDRLIFQYHQRNETIRRLREKDTYGHRNSKVY